MSIWEQDYDTDQIIYDLRNGLERAKKTHTKCVTFFSLYGHYFGSSSHIWNSFTYLKLKLLGTSVCQTRYSSTQK